MLKQNGGGICDHEVGTGKTLIMCIAAHEMKRLNLAHKRETWLKNQGDPSRIVSLMDKINPNALLIGFGRRFATYKRAHLLFTDLDRLAKIVNNPDYPVQFLFTGKAHPHDGAGQGLIKRIIEISRRPEFLGKIISWKTMICSWLAVWYPVWISG